MIWTDLMPGDVVKVKRRIYNLFIGQTLIVSEISEQQSTTFLWFTQQYSPMYQFFIDDKFEDFFEVIELAD